MLNVFPHTCNVLISGGESKVLHLKQDFSPSECPTVQKLKQKIKILAVKDINGATDVCLHYAYPDHEIRNMEVLNTAPTASQSNNSGK